MGRGPPIQTLTLSYTHIQPNSAARVGSVKHGAKLRVWFRSRPPLSETTGDWNGKAFSEQHNVFKELLATEERLRTTSLISTVFLCFECLFCCWASSVALLWFKLVCISYLFVLCVFTFWPLLHNCSVVHQPFLYFAETVALPNRKRVDWPLSLLCMSQRIDFTHLVWINSGSSLPLLDRLLILDGAFAQHRYLRQNLPMFWVLILTKEQQFMKRTRISLNGEHREQPGHLKKRSKSSIWSRI